MAVKLPFLFYVGCLTMTQLRESSTTGCKLALKVMHTYLETTHYRLPTISVIGQLCRSQQSQQLLKHWQSARYLCFHCVQALYIQPHRAPGTPG